jgi:ATP-dependent helicase/nuclease subunit B
MSTVRLISPAINLVEEVIGTLKPNGNNYSRTIVVFPGKRPAHVLRKKLAERIGSSFIPPKVFSIDVFIEFLCTEHLQIRTRPIEDLDAVAVLFELHQGMQEEEKIGREHFTTLERFYPVGVKIYSELEELMIASITPERLKGAVSSVTLASANSLSLLYGPFYEELRKRGYTTRAMNYQSLAERIRTIDLSRYNSITLAGFFAFTQTEETIVRHLLTMPNVTMFFQEGKEIERTLASLNVSPEPEGEHPLPEQHFYESPDAHGQLFVLNTVLKRTFTEPIINSEEAAVVLPSSENLFPLYHQTLSVFEQNTYNLALGYPLSRTPVYGFLMSLLDVMVSSKEGEVFVPKYLQFMLHPYTKNILYKTRTDVTRALIHSIEDDCLEHSARVFIRLEDIEQNPKLMEKVIKRLEREEVEMTSDEAKEHLIRMHSMTLRALLKVGSVKEFAEACITVLQFINEHSTAHRHPYFRPFVETLLEQLVSLKGSLLSGYSFGKLEHYLLFLRHFIESAEVPFAGTPLQGLQVLGFLETRGLQFENVFVIDVNDDVLPGKAQQDVLLPLAVREDLGLSTYRDQERIKAYLFDVLRRSAKNIHYFYVNNHEKEQSRFIAQLQWNEQKQTQTLKPVNTEAQEYAIDLGSTVPDDVVKTEVMMQLLKELPYSSTALDSYLTCGLKFYYRYVLRLQEKGEISGDVESSDVGKIVHAILFEYFSAAKDRELTAGDLDRERLKRVISENFRSFYGSTQFGEQFFTKRQVEIHLMEFLEQFQQPMLGSSSVVIEALEEKFGTEIDGIQFTGNADRIETRNDRTFIIDYKTGQSGANYLIRFNELNVDDRSTWKDAIGSVQLVMYVMLYSIAKNIQPEQIVPAFLFLGKKELDASIEIPLFDTDEEMKEWYPKLKKIVLALTKEINDPAAAFTPTQQPKSDCPDCPYKVMCGRQWVDLPKSY